MKTLKIIKYAFFAIGVGALIGSFLFFKNTKQFIDKGVTASGTVINLLRQVSEDSDGNTSYMYYPEVKFQTADGKSITFQANTGSNPPSYSVGEKIDVLYLPESPNKAKIKSFVSLWLGALVFLIVGLSFGSIGGGMILHGIMKKNKIAKLKVSGQRLRTKFKAVERNTSLKVGGRSPYQIVSQLNMGDKVYVFYSDNLWFDPSDSIKKGQEITVLVEPGDMDKYWMDTSFLPKLQN